MLIFLNRNRPLRSICVTALLGRAGLTCDLFSTILDRLRIRATEENGRKTLSETSQNSESVDESSCTPRNQLIIQLSQQVTTLDVENQELKQELETTKRLLQKLELKERGIRTKSRTKREELCVNMAGLNLTTSTSKVELHG